MIKSNKLKKEKLALNGFVYWMEKELKERYYWSCSEYPTLSCRSRLITMKDRDGRHEVLRSPTAHSHSPSPQNILIQHAKSHLRDEACRDLHGTPTQIVDKINRSNIVRQNKIGPMMGTDDAMRQIVRRVKKKNTAISYPTSPETFDFQYDGDFEDLYINGEILLIDDMLWEEKRVSIFSNNTLFDHFCDAELLVMDATFKITPKPFKQTFIIHGNIPGFDNYFVYPLIWILMTNKDADSYTLVFESLRQIAINKGKIINAKFSLLDFELATRKSLQLVFPWIEQNACFFHLRQIIMRSLKRLGLFDKFSRNSQFNDEIMLIIALAFFTPDEIKVLVQVIYGSMSADAKKFLDWFKINYVQKADGSEAVNSPEFWSLHNLVRLGMQLTSNGSEQYHHSLFLACGKQMHLPLYKILTVVKEQILKSEQNIQKVFSEVAVKRRNKKCQQKEKILQKILDKKDEPNRCLLQSLRAIAVALTEINRFMPPIID